MNLDDKFHGGSNVFDGQFGYEDGKLLYRRYKKGPGYLVTEDERAAFVARYNKQSSRLFWAFMAAIVAFSLVYVGFATATDSDVDEWVVYVGMSVLIGAFAALQLVAHTAPNRALRNRAVEEREFTPKQARRRALNDTSWAQLGVGVVVIGALLWSKLGDGQPVVGWRWLWVILGVATVGVAAYTGVQKWRLEERGQDRQR